MQAPHLRGGSATGVSTHEGKHENEEAILDTMLSSMARGALPTEAWDRLHADAQREHRLSELAFGFESVSQGKRLKTLPPPVAAEFFFQAAHFFGDVFSDDMGAVTYLERALALAPTHSASFEKIELLLKKTEQSKKLSEVYVTAAQHRPRSEQAPLLRRAADLLSKDGGEQDRIIELLQHAQRLEPGDASGRARLEALYMSTNRLRDVARLNEQALTSEPPPDGATRKNLLSRIVEVYADKLNEPERALPYVEHLLAMDPMHEEARRVAHRLVAIKGLAARAAGALATACEKFGTPEETAQYLTIELEHTRGAKRVAPLLKLGTLKQERMGDKPGAFQVYEQALALDAAEDELRARYVALADEIGAWVDAAKTLGRALTAVKDPVVKAKVSAQLGVVLQRRGDTKRATLMLSGVLAAPEAPVEAVLAAANALREIHECEGDERALCDVLEWIAELELDTDKRRAADERLAEVATQLGDTNRAIAAYERLLPTDARPRALAALLPLYDASGDPSKRARLFEEHARDTTDPAQARELMMRGAALRAKEGADASAAIAACVAIVERFGAGRDVLALLVPILEAQQRWDDLAKVLAQGAEILGGRERGQVMSRVGTLRARLRDPNGAIDAFSQALAADADEPTARKMLDRLLRLGDHRLAAARALEPVYRREASTGRLLEVLELRGALASDVDERLAALREAADLCLRAETPEPKHLADIVGQGLAESVEHGRSPIEWLERLDSVVRESVDAKHFAAILGKAIAHREVTGAELSVLAKQAARAHEEGGDVPTAIELYERVLAFDEDDSASAPLAELYARAGRWDDLSTLIERRLHRLVGDEARRARIALFDIASAQGEQQRARQQCELLLADPDLTSQQLDAVEHAAQQLGDAKVSRAVLARRATMASAPLDLPKLYESLEKPATGDENFVQPWLLQTLALYRRALESECPTDDVLAATARLALATGDTEQALSALRARRVRAEGPARLVLDVQIARVLLSRTPRWAEAIGVLRSVLAEAPNDPMARALMARLLSNRATRPEAILALEHADASAEDSATSEQILTCLIDAPADPSDAETRTGWFSRLCDIQREDGRSEAALVTAMRAVRELPDVAGLWDRAEELARALARPDEVSALYDEVLARPLAHNQALSIGQRAVQFHDEWFENSACAVRILEGVLERDPSAEWAFNRLKLRLDAMERWDELFALYDRALDSAQGGRRATLLEEAALTAKDFADRPDDAIRYLEELVHHRPGEVILANALERLYDRQGRHRELVALLTARVPSLAQKDRLRARARIGALSLDQLGDPAAALEIIEPTLRSGDIENEAAPEVWALLERILAVPPTNDPPRGRAPVRQRAAGWLRGHYANVGRHLDLARMVLVQLEAASSVEERVSCHLLVAELSEMLGDEATALEHLGMAATLDPEDDAKRAKLVELAVRTGRYATLADSLATAADASKNPGQCVALTMQAAAVHTDRMSDADGAIALLASAFEKRNLSNGDVVAVGRRLESLLAATERAEQRLDVLERIAIAETDIDARRETVGVAGHLAAHLGQYARAIALWQMRLDADDRDREALDGLVDLFARSGGDVGRLAEVLGQRARLAATEDRGHADRVRVAKLLGDVLGRPGDAIAAWRDIERDFGQDDDALVSLAALLRSTQRWQELVALLERAAERTSDGPTRAEFLRQIGEVHLKALGSQAAAAAMFTLALDADPRNAGARAGMLALANEDTHRVVAVAALLGALRACDDWNGILRLTEHRLHAATSAPERLAILFETMEIAEGRAGDTRRAFDAMHRAFALAPWDQRVQGELARLAEAMGAWRVLVDAYQQAIDGAARGDARLVAQLREWTAAVLETRLDDANGALEAYLRVIAETSDVGAGCTAVRVAGQLSRWQVAAKIVVDLARAHGGAPRELFASYEQAATMSGLWDEAAQALEDTISTEKVSGPAARDLEARLAEWHRDRRGDPEAAQAAFHRALAHDAANATLLAALAELQRQSSGGALVHTLLRLAQATGGDLPVLREAAEAARETMGDSVLARSILADLLAIARARCTKDGDGQAVAFAEWAIEGLAQLHEREGDFRSLVAVLAEGDQLPLEPIVRRSMRRRAARIALDRLGDHEQAIALYLSLFDDDPHDTEAVERLLSTYAAHGRTRDLLRLRERQIDAATDTGQRIALRLETAGLLVELSESARASQVLRASLREEACHPATVEALGSVLLRSSRTRELCELLEEQAQLAEAAGDEKRAAGHWFQAATIAATILDAPAAAETYHTRVVALEPRRASLDALAHLASARADHPLAAHWLEQLLDVVGPDTRADTLLRLCDALIASSDVSGAVERLEGALAAEPDAEVLRDRLGAVYREQSAWAPLAQLVTDGAKHTSSKPTKMARLLEAASLFAERCDEPALAIPLLEEASALAPEDQAVRLALAGAMAGANRSDDARSILQAVIFAFGRRRPKERARVHYQLAQLELAADDHARAIVELDTAASIDQENPEILRALAEAARDTGQVEKAAKAYRALLDVLRRCEASGESPLMPRSEVLVELHALAEQQGDSARALEILESALETASKEDLERERAAGTTSARGNQETLEID